MKNFPLELVPENYQRVAKMLVCALQLTETDVSVWHGLTKVLSARLSPKERGALAWAVLRALTPEQIIATVEVVLPQGAGQPVPPLFNYMDQAAFWADMAAPDELEAYCFNSFNRMPAKRQAAFLDFVQGRAAA